MKKFIFLLFTLLLSVTIFAQEAIPIQVVQDPGITFEQIDQPLYKEMRAIFKQDAPARQLVPSDPPTRALIFSEGFEGVTGVNLPSTWTVYNSLIGTPTATSNGAWIGTGTTVHSGSRAALINLNAAAPAQNWGYLWSPEFSLTAGVTYEISFWMHWQAGTSTNQVDYLNVTLYKAESGGSFDVEIQNIADIGPFTGQTSMPQSNWTLFIAYVTPTETGSDYYLEFDAANLNCFGYTTYRGGHLRVDDVAVNSLPDHALKLNPSFPYSQIPTNQTFTPSAVVTNIGAQTQTNVVLSGTFNGTNIGTTSHASLASLATASISLPPPVNPVLGTNTLSYSVSSNQGATDSGSDSFTGTLNTFATDNNSFANVWAGTATSMYGNIYTFSKPTKLCQVQAQFYTGSTATSFGIRVYPVTGPNTIGTAIHTSTGYSKTNATAWFNASLATPITLPEGSYYICVTGANINMLGTAAATTRLGYLGTTTGTTLTPLAMLNVRIIVDLPDNDIASVANGFPYTQIPLSQAGTLPFPTTSGKAQNLGLVAQTNVKLTTTYNATTLGTSTAIASVAPLSTSADMLVTTPAGTVFPTTLGTNNVIYAVTSDEPDENPANNTETYQFQITNNTYAIDGVVDPLTAANLGSGAGNNALIGNTFTISKSVVVDKVVVGLCNTTQYSTYNYNVQIYSKASATTLQSTTPLFSQAATRTGTGGWFTINVPATLLTPGDYFLCFQESSTFTIAAARDEVPGRALQHRGTSGTTLTNSTAYGSMAVRMIMATHTIDATAGANGIISPAGEVYVNSGTSSPTFTFTPDTGYEIDQVLIDGTNNPSAVTAGAYTFTNVLADHTIEVTFKGKPYILTLNPAPGTVTPTSVSVTYNDPIGTLPVPTQTGYTYTGWIIGTTAINSTYVWNYLTNQTATTTYTVNTYTVVYNGNNNTGGTTASSTHTYDVAKALTTNGFNRIGYTFAGWATSATGAVVYTNGQTVTNLTAENGATVNLFAVWTPITYTVSYNGNTNTGGSTANSSHTYDVAKALTTNGFTKTGYTFAGWATSATGEVEYTNGQSVTNLSSTNGATVTLYAKWTANTYELTFDPSTGTTTMLPRTVTYDQPIGYLSDATQPNCPFIGWFIDGLQVTATTPWTWTGDKEAIAKFYYPIALTVTGGAYGTVTPSTPTINYDLGDNVTYNFNPNFGAHIASIIINGEEVFAGDSELTEDTFYDFVNMNKYYSVQVTFAPNCYALNVEIGAGAVVTVTIPPSIVPVNCVTHGLPAIVNFSSVGCAEITNIWIEGEGDITGTSYIIPTLLGKFPQMIVETDAQVFEINSTVNNSTMGSITPAGITQLGCNEGQVYTFAAASGYQLKAVYINGVKNAAAAAAGTYTFSNVNKNHTIHVVFDILPVYIIQFGPCAAQNAGGEVYPTNNPTALYYIQVDSGTVAVPFTIQAATGYVIDKVFVDDVINTQAAFYGTYTFTNVKINHSIFATFKPIMFTITAAADPNGSITPSGNVQAQYGSTPMFQAVPNQGYHLNTILVDGIPQQGDTYTFEPVKANHDIFATFTVNTYIINATAGANGIISPAGEVEVEHGSNKTFNFIPDVGYKVDKVFIDGAENPTAALAGTFTFNNITQGSTIHVTFTKPTFSITTNFGIGGTVLPSGVDYVEYDAHSEIYVFNPDPGFIVKYAYVDGENNPLAVQNMEHRFLNVKANHQLYVVFAPANFTILATTTDGGTINPAGLITVPNGADKTIFFAPNAGYKLDRVNIDGINDPEAVVAGFYKFTDVSDNHTIAAQFVKIMYEIFLPDPNEGAIAIPTGGSGLTVEYGNAFTFVVELLEGYTQADITIRANGIVINPVAGVYTLNNITIDQYITVDGLVANTYKVVAKAYAGGAISPAGTSMVEHGKDITFEMKPNKDYEVARIVVNGIDENVAETFTIYNLKADAIIEVYFKYNPVGIDEIEGNINVYSYNKVVTIVNEQQIPIKSIEIMDMNGRIVWTGVANEITLNVANGIYHVRITTDDNTFTTKVSIK